MVGLPAVLSLHWLAPADAGPDGADCPPIPPSMEPPGLQRGHAAAPATENPVAAGVAAARAHRPTGCPASAATAVIAAAVSAAADAVAAVHHGDLKRTPALVRNACALGTQQPRGQACHTRSTGAEDPTWCYHAAS